MSLALLFLMRAYLLVFPLLALVWAGLMVAAMLHGYRLGLAASALVAASCMLGAIGWGWLAWRQLPLVMGVE
jgi:hypothetical protein